MRVITAQIYPLSVNQIITGM